MTEIIRRLNYNKYFNDNDTIQTLLNPLDKEEMFSAVSYLINKSKSEKDAKETIDNWFKNRTIKQNLIEKTQTNTSILNIYSSLKLLTYILEKENVEKPEKISIDDFELRLFKIYLLLNSEQDLIEEKGAKNLPDSESKELLSASLITISYHDYDLQNYNLNEVFLAQLVKSIDFFQFIENDNKLKNHLSVFLSNYKLNTWQEWIIKLLILIVPILKYNNENTDENETYSEIIIEKDDDFEVNLNFLDLFSIPLEYIELPDFVSLRSNPILRVGEDKFLVINKLFLVERIFKSVVFEFSLKINKQVERDSRLKDFRGIYCDFFSEQVLAYNTLYNCFPNNSKWIKVKGEDFKKIGYTSEPDYYIRFKNKVFIFESKDVILKGDEKQSRDFSILSNCLKEKFIKIEKDGTTSNKALLQIIENIKRVFNKYYQGIDTDYKTEFLNIYPILVVHDRQFDTIEINRLINIWFKEELELNFNKNELDKINDLTIINIDTLILYQEHFKKRGKYGLEYLINNYFEFIKPKTCRKDEVTQNYLNRSISFSTFVSRKFGKTHFTNPPEFIDNYIKKLNLK